MKSRTSSFNTALRKNMTRFAPCWGLYTIGLVMILLLMSTDSPYWFANDLAEWIIVMVLMNLGYALLVAQLLFGDLFNSRMCNALHAMPLRRESWFGANVLAGILFSFLPTLVTALIALPFLTTGYVTNGWQVALYWLLGGNLSYLAFFGIAVLCVHLTGNRFAMAVIYGIVNFAAVILYWLVDTLYTPMIYGVNTWAEPFFRLTPVVHMMDAEYLDVVRLSSNENILGSVVFSLTDEWYKLLVWAGVGVALLGLALILYRKRKLECAGDFMAFKVLEPVFLVIYTLIVGTCFQFFSSNIIGMYGNWVYLFVGLAVGWFTGQMLIKRTIRVFKWKIIGGCLLLMALVVGSLLAIFFDVFGIERWIPEANEVKAVYVYRGNTTRSIPNTAVKLTEEADIETILYVHSVAMHPAEERAAEIVAIETKDGHTTNAYWDRRFSFALIYELENGRTVFRNYYSYADTEIGQILEPWFSTTQSVLGFAEEALPEVAKYVDETYIDGCENLISKTQLEGLMEAIAADCREGNMAQSMSFHEPTCENERIYIEFRYTDDNRLHQWFGLSVYGCCTNTIQWLEDNNIFEAIEEYREAMQ